MNPRRLLRRGLQRVVQIEHLTLLYLHHLPFAGWQEFTMPFLLAGGLESLVKLLACPNLYLRGQAVDCLLQVLPRLRVTLSTLPLFHGSCAAPAPVSLFEAGHGGGPPRRLRLVGAAGWP